MAACVACLAFASFLAVATAVPNRLDSRQPIDGDTHDTRDDSERVYETIPVEDERHSLVASMLLHESTALAAAGTPILYPDDHPVTIAARRAVNDMFLDPSESGPWEVHIVCAPGKIIEFSKHREC